MPGLRPEDFEKEPVGSSISVKEGVDRIEFDEVMRRSVRKIVSRLTLELLLTQDRREPVLHIPFDEPCQAERSWPSAGVHRPVQPGPVIDVLQKMTVYGLVPVDGDRLRLQRQRPKSGERALEALQGQRVSQPFFVLEDVGTIVTIGMLSPIHSAATSDATPFLSRL